MMNDEFIYAIMRGWGIEIGVVTLIVFIFACVKIARFEIEQRKQFKKLVEMSNRQWEQFK